jgi:hemerythrin-like domain-containing protein
MTEHKTMNTIIHAAFRRDLVRFTAALDAFRSGDKARAERLGTAWDNLAAQLHHHHEDEETIFWPALRDLGAQPELVGDLEGEHAQMLSALDTADSAMRTFRADPSDQNTAAARGSIEKLSLVLNDHLAHEERDLEPLAVQHLQSPQMKDAARKVRRAHKGGAGTFIAWLQDGADDDARTALRHDIPAPVLFVLGRVAGRDYNRRIATVWV